MRDIKTTAVSYADAMIKARNFAAGKDFLVLEHHCARSDNMYEYWQVSAMVKDPANGNLVSFVAELPAQVRNRRKVSA